jgi:hypothetical protein
MFLACRNISMSEKSTSRTDEFFTIAIGAVDVKAISAFGAPNV